MENFQEKVQILNSLSCKFARTFAYKSNKVSDPFDFSKRLSLNRDLTYTLTLNRFYGWEKWWVA